MITRLGAAIPHSVDEGNPPQRNGGAQYARKERDQVQNERESPRPNPLSMGTIVGVPVWVVARHLIQD